VEGMNEVLVAGDAVATRPRLDPYNEVFQDWRDRMFWDRVEVRRITSTSA